VSYRQAVIAISEGLQGLHAIEAADTGSIAAEIVAQQGRIPDYLRLPVQVATLIFDWSGILSGGKRFQAKDTAGKMAQLERWKHSRVGFCRNFIRFYDSLFLLIALQEEHA
jgi:hypothetical protein